MSTFRMFACGLIGTACYGASPAELLGQAPIGQLAKGRGGNHNTTVNVFLSGLGTAGGCCCADHAAPGGQVAQPGQAGPGGPPRPGAGNPKPGLGMTLDQVPAQAVAGNHGAGQKGKGKGKGVADPGKGKGKGKGAATAQSGGPGAKGKGKKHGAAAVGANGMFIGPRGPAGGVLWGLPGGQPRQAAPGGHSAALIGMRGWRGRN